MLLLPPAFAPPVAEPPAFVVPPRLELPPVALPDPPMPTLLDRVDEVPPVLEPPELAPPDFEIEPAPPFPLPLDDAAPPVVAVVDELFVRRALDPAVPLESSLAPPRLDSVALDAAPPVDKAPLVDEDRPLARVSEDCPPLVASPPCALVVDEARPPLPTNEVALPVRPPTDAFTPPTSVASKPPAKSDSPPSHATTTVVRRTKGKARSKHGLMAKSG